MGANIGIGIANAIGFKHTFGRGGDITPKPIAAWSAAGKTNEDEDRAVLKDLTGNGHDITLNGFAFSEMSGYGGYKVDFIKTFSTLISRVEGTATGTKINITKVIETNAFIENGVAKVIPSFKIKVSGNTSNGIYVRYRFYVDIEGSVQAKFIDLKTDGVYTLPQTDESSYNGFMGSKIGECDITIELLPEYPDALVFDGVDDYGICSSLPNLADFTVISYKKWLTAPAYINTSFAKGNVWPDLIFAGESSPGRPTKTFVYSFGVYTNVGAENVKDINYQTPLMYNGVPISKGFVADNNTDFIIGNREKTSSYYSNIAFYSLYLFDRSLTEEEIKTFIRKNIDPNYLLPSEIPTPDCYYDFSLGSNDDENREVVKDQSGNGNDAKIYNCAFAGISGYGGYGTDFTTWTEYPYGGTVSNITKNSFIIASTTGKADSALFYYEPNNFKKCKLKITGLTEGSLAITQRGGGTEDLLTIEKDGVYEVINPSEYSVRFTSPTARETCSILVEVLPEYEGALVLDGVDDYVALEAFDSGFKTMFMLCNPFVLNKILYDQRLAGVINSQFAIYNFSNSIAYESRNSGTTYINSIINNYITTNTLIDKKHLITIVNDNDFANGTIPIIGTSRNLAGENFSKMALYKFLGFKEALNEDQIKAVIQKYNLLDGVDEIEVS